MPHNAIQKYFNHVFAWFWDIYVLQVGDDADLLVILGWIKSKVLERTLEHGFILVHNLQSKHMAQRFAVGEIDNNGKPKKTWIAIEMLAAKPFDTFPR